MVRGQRWRGFRSWRGPDRLIIEVVGLNALECHGGAVVRDKVAVAASGCTEGDNVR
jgi:hypothetical protein